MYIRNCHIPYSLCTTSTISFSAQAISVIQTCMHIAMKTSAERQTERQKHTHRENRQMAIDAGRIGEMVDGQTDALRM